MRKAEKSFKKYGRIIPSCNGLVEGLKEYQASSARWSQYNIGYIMENSRQERVYKPWPKQIGMRVMRKK